MPTRELQLRWWCKSNKKNRFFTTKLIVFRPLFVWPRGRSLVDWPFLHSEGLILNSHVITHHPFHPSDEELQTALDSVIYCRTEGLNLRRIIGGAFFVSHLGLSLQQKRPPVFNDKKKCVPRQTKNDSI